MFEIDLWDASIAPAMAVAAVAGILSFLSPCVLPIVPPYLAFMAGAAAGDRRATRGGLHVLRAAAFFVLGLSTVFLLLGLAASTFGRLLLAYQREMAFFAGVVIVVFGLHFLGLLRVPVLAREARFEAAAATGTALGAYVFGLAFAFGWTPCIGPVLGSILALAAQGGSPGRGLLLMAAYAAGLGLPFLLTALFLEQAVVLMARLKRNMAAVERITGALLVAVGLLMLTGAFSGLSYWLLEAFPGLATIG
jgi:cytochrome c-type biogenesis protein